MLLQLTINIPKAKNTTLQTRVKDSTLKPSTEVTLENPLRVTASDFSSPYMPGVSAREEIHILKYGPVTGMMKYSHPCIKGVNVNVRSQVLLKAADMIKTGKYNWGRSK